MKIAGQAGQHRLKYSKPFMKVSLKIFALFFILTIFTATPSFTSSVAHGQTESGLRAQVVALLARIQALTAQLNASTVVLPAVGLQTIGVQNVGTGGGWSSRVPTQPPYLGYTSFSSKHPVRVIVPAIGLDASIEHMGLNTRGEMAVPDGSGDSVGWYKDGTMPGRTGSAVLAAHVYAAFSRLQYAPVGSDIYIVTRDNSRLHFVVSEKATYGLENLLPELLFNRDDDKRLNLITCAGQYIPTLGTYDQRLVLYATLVNA
jgi:sortase (surface protein transpeptidase)